MSLILLSRDCGGICRQAFIAMLHSVYSKSAHLHRLVYCLFSPYRCVIEQPQHDLLVISISKTQYIINTLNLKLESVGLMRVESRGSRQCLLIVESVVGKPGDICRVGPM